MKNKVAFVYLLILILLIFMFSFSYYIEIRQDTIHATQTQQAEETAIAGAEILHAQLTAIAQGTPIP